MHSHTRALVHVFAAGQDVTKHMRGPAHRNALDYLSRYCILTKEMLKHYRLESSLVCVLCVCCVCVLCVCVVCVCVFVCVCVCARLAVHSTRHVLTRSWSVHQNDFRQFGPRR